MQIRLVMDTFTDLTDEMIKAIAKSAKTHPQYYSPKIWSYNRLKELADKGTLFAADDDGFIDDFFELLTEVCRENLGKWVDVDYVEFYTE